MRSWTEPTGEMIEKVLRTVKKETDRQYFFSKLKNPMWLKPLFERGYFNVPPEKQVLPDNHVHYPRWPELTYLVNVAEFDSDLAIKILLDLPKIDNPIVYEGIISAALKLKGKASTQLLPKLIEYIEFKNIYIGNNFTDLVVHWNNESRLSESLELVKRLVRFNEDPRAKAKRSVRKDVTDDLHLSLEPRPAFSDWEYQELMEKCAKPLAEKVPYQTFLVMVDAVSTMIYLGKHRDELEKGDDEDYSVIWFRRLDKSSPDSQDSKEILVNTLTYTGEQVYFKAPDAVPAMDQVLRNQRWKIFKRLRQHLYALNTNEQTLPWIREFIFTYENFGSYEYLYEFQLMLRNACEHFGMSLLSTDELTKITDAILSGPSKTDYREWIGDRYSEEYFQQRQRCFHRAQLRPFASLLTGTVKSYYEELVQAESPAITDDSYSPIGESSGGFVSYRSPKSVAELESFTDEDLLSFINDWSDERRDSEDWLVEINIPALAEAFLAVFKSKIVPDKQRLNYWIENRDDIKRPIYASKIISVMQEQINAKDFSNLPVWIEFCHWLLKVSDTKQVDESTDTIHQPQNDWSSPRREVVDFVAACIKKDIEAPISARACLASLLLALVSSADKRLDESRPVLLNRDDPITEAINNVRSRALETLINFGLWVRRQIGTDPIEEVAEIISERIKPTAKFPLTRPEYAILGMHFTNLWIINPDWVIEQKESLFPTSNLTIWRDAFGSYIRFNQPNKRMFDVLREQHLFAMENLTAFLTLSKEDKGFIDRLGQHIFTYYIWGVFQLSGEASLLEQFYLKTDSHHEYWARLFNHVGRSFKNSGKQLDSVLIERAISYFEWRFDAEEPSELQEFNVWLEAECFAAEWRLKAYLRVLNFGFGKGTGLYSALKVLNKLLPEHQALVVECFAKITDLLDQRTQMQLSENTAKPILQSGLISEEPEVRTNAEHARENLLRLGRFDFLELN